jgi:hypothetical protein
MTDRYTKAVLTIIAAALSILVMQNFVRQSWAQLDIQKVQICDGTMSFKCLSINEITHTFPVPTDKPYSIPTTYKTYALPVELDNKN